MASLPVLCLVLATFNGDAPAATTGDRIVAFARSRIGETVGDGECTALVTAALDHVGLPRRRGQGGWGEPVVSLREVRPGDILTFEDARFAGRRLNPNRTITRWSTHYPNHVAIVDEVAELRGTILLRIIHQNARIRGRDTSDAVKVWTVDMSTFQGGTLRAFRPGAPPDPESPAAARGS